MRVATHRALRTGPMIIGLVACAHATSTPADVPVAFGRWRPPEGQSCYVDAFQPRAMPPLSTLLDSVAVMAELRTRSEGSVLIALAFDSSGRTVRARVIDRRMPVATADSVHALVTSHLRAPATEEGWGARLLASTGTSAALTMGRRDVCPPALARIEPLALTPVAITEGEPDVAPSPDYVIRGVGAPAGPPRVAVDRAVAGLRERDRTRLTVDSTGTSPDPMAIGDSALTLRVLIDTTGAIAHAEIPRAVGATLDKGRLVAELARYRFHPALEDRVPTPAWVILRIK